MRSSTVAFRVLLIGLLPVFALAAIAAGIVLGSELSIDLWRRFWQEAGCPTSSSDTSG